MSDRESSAKVKLTRGEVEALQLFADSGLILGVYVEALSNAGLVRREGGGVTITSAGRGVLSDAA